MELVAVPAPAPGFLAIPAPAPGLLAIPTLLFPDSWRFPPLLLSGSRSYSCSNLYSGIHKTVEEEDDC